ncbi:hypothetical protein [Kaarinaea lacus]
MKTNSIHRKQSGFFDLGLSLGLILVFGSTAAVIDKDHEQQDNLAKPATEIADQNIVVVKTEQE